MRAGTLRHRVTIQSATASTGSAYGERADSWSDVATVHASVVTLSGAEAERASQVHPTASVQVDMRYRSDVTTAHRLQHGSRYLYPVAVIPDERESERVTLMCREEV